MNLLCISDFYTNLSVFESQVHTLCNKHSNYMKVRLLALCNHKEILKQKLSDAKYELIKVLKFPKMFIPVINKMNTIIVTFLFKDKFIKLLDWADIIHCRGHVGAMYAINLLDLFNLKKTVIADIRGAIVDELANRKNFLSKIYSYYAEKLERIIFNKSDCFFFVSENMKNFYKKRYNFSQKSYIFPTIVDEKYFFKSEKIRKEMREKLKIGNRITYIYVGSVEYWQNLDRIILKFDEINKVSNYKKYFFIILTTDKRWVIDFCIKNKINTKNFYIDKVPYKEVGKYLNAADYGVIIRDKNNINYVASPTKINEYLACGLKIVDKLEYIGTEKFSNNFIYKPLKKILYEQYNIYKILCKKF